MPLVNVFVIILYFQTSFILIIFLRDPNQGKMITVSLLWRNVDTGRKMDDVLMGVSVDMIMVKQSQN